MVIDLAKLGQTPRKFEFRLKPNDVDLENESVKIADEILILGEAAKSAAQVEIKGKIETKLSIDCSRCLEPVNTKLSVPFDITFVSIESADIAKEHELQENELDSSILENDEINVNEVAREQILLNVPEQIFCTEDCKGLCPKCGSNRNLIDCKCEENEIDPRWSALKDLK